MSTPIYFVLFRITQNIMNFPMKKIKKYLCLSFWWNHSGKTTCTEKFFLPVVSSEKKTIFSTDIHFHFISFLCVFSFLILTHLYCVVLMQYLEENNCKIYSSDWLRRCFFFFREKWLKKNVWKLNFMLQIDLHCSLRFICLPTLFSLLTAAHSFFVLYV